MDNISTALYLLFQVFVANPSSVAFPPQGEIKATVQDVAMRIGITGDKRRKLGFVVGPIAFNQRDDEVQKLVAQSFAIAREKNVAVAFHLDDHMFWDRCSDLISDKANVEWTDWDGRLSAHRRLDWGPEPTKIGPIMCLNSPKIKIAIQRRAHFIAAQIKREVDRLRLDHKEHLFAGIIIGWETRIGREFSTNRRTGYHALANAGFSSKNSVAECDAQLVKVVQAFIETWAKGLSASGIPRDKLYCHLGFTPQGLGVQSGLTELQAVEFAPVSVAFSGFYRPGFSTYPFADTLEQVQSKVAERGNPPWISAEGTNVVPNGMQGEATMESYLAKMFNHGAVMVNIFSWGIGGESQKNNLFRRVTENEDALRAYRKFLSGAPLVESKERPTFSPRRLQEKIRAIQSQVPPWIQRTGRRDLIELRMMKIDAAIRTNKFEEVNKTADEILELIKSN